MAKLKQGNTAGKPEEGAVTRSIRVSKDLDTAVKEIAAIRRISVANAYRILVEKGLQCRQDGTFGQQLASILGNMKYKTERNELILKALLDMLHMSEASQQFMWNVVLDFAAGRQVDIEQAMIKARIDTLEEIDKQINKIMKGEDKLSISILNDILAMDLGDYPSRNKFHRRSTLNRR